MNVNTKTQDNITFYNTEKNKTMILHNKYLYYFKRSNIGSEIYCCSVKKCKSYIELINKKNLTIHTEHTCSSQKSDTEIRMFNSKQELIKLALTTCLKPEEIIAQVLTNLDIGEQSQMPKLKTLKALVRRLRKSQHSNNINDTINKIPKFLYECIDGGSFIMKDCNMRNGKRIIILVDEKK